MPSAPHGIELFAWEYLRSQRLRLILLLLLSIEADNQNDFNETGLLQAILAHLKHPDVSSDEAVAGVEAVFSMIYQNGWGRRL